MIYSLWIKQPKDLNSDSTLGNCLFGAVKLHKNADQDKSNCRGYDIGFNPHLHSFHGQGESSGEMPLILGLKIVFLCILMVKTKLS